MTKTADTNDGSCTVADCSLREAIVAANALLGPHTINVPAGIYTLTIAGAGEDDAATGDLDIRESMTISGAGADVTTINGGGLDRVFDIDPGDNGPTVVIQNLTITNGGAVGIGGGVYVNSSGCPDVTLTNVAISGNTASWGGGVANGGCGSLTITNSTISGNTAVTRGGGIYNYYPLTITNSTISGNVVQDGEGGGIYNAYTTVSLLNVTVANNSALGGDGVYVVGVGAVASFNNTIVANNGTENCVNAGGTITSLGYNLDSANTCNFTQPTDLINTNPLLGPLANNGGPTQTHALLVGSPAIDTANNATCPPTDQRGVARMDGDGDTIVECDRGAYEYVPAAAAADLSVTKTDAPDPVNVGQNLTYTIIVSNSALGPASGVTLTDTLPAGVTFVSATPTQGTCSQAAGVVTCALGDLDNSTSATVTIVVTPTAPGLITNTATVTATESDPNPTDNTATATTTVSGPLPDLTGSIVGPANVCLGQAIGGAITLSVTNSGPVASGSFSVGVYLSPDAVITTADLLLNGGREFVASVPANTTIPVPLSTGASVPGTAPLGPQYLGLLVDEFNTVAESNETNNYAAIPINVTATCSADLSVTKADSPDPVTFGNNLTYTILVTNNGPSLASGVTLTDTLPAGVTFVSATPTQGSCSQASGVVTCNLGTINNGGTATVTILVTPTAAGLISNTAAVAAAESDPNPANNSAAATTTVQEFGPPDLPQTGQTTSYATGDDGDWQAGVEWPSPRFVVSGDCVRDELTGLLWPRNANRFGLRTWSQALNDANNLSLCGYSDWRLPNIQELASFSHAGERDVASWLRAQEFTNVQPDYYWSSTTYVGPTTLGPESALRRPGGADGGASPQAAAVTSAWVLYLPDGNRDALDKGTRLFVWPVRGGEGGLIGLPQTGQPTSYAAGDDGDVQAGVPWPSPRFTVSGACVTDELTGLMWRQQPDGVDRSWETALGYANSLSLCGYSDWRLPNRTELRSLIHHGQPSSAAWLNGQGFSGTQADYYWTATTYAGDTAWGWIVDLEEGADYIADKFFETLAWPVRGDGSGADLSVTKADSPDPVAPGGALTYTLTVTNQGPDAATNVQLTDTLPTGVTFVSVTPGSPTCSQTGGVVTCNLGSLAPGARTQVTILVTAPGTTGAMTNTATVASSIPDLNPANNTATAVTTIGAGAPACVGTGASTLRGRVTDGGAGAAGVTLTLTGPGGCLSTTTTKARGRYRFLNLGNETYTVTPTQAGCSFTPASRTVTLSGTGAQANFIRSCP